MRMAITKDFYEVEDEFVLVQLSRIRFGVENLIRKEEYFVVVWHGLLHACRGRGLFGKLWFIKQKIFYLFYLYNDY